VRKKKEVMNLFVEPVAFVHNTIVQLLKPVHICSLLVGESWQNIRGPVCQRMQARSRHGKISSTLRRLSV